MNVKLKYDLLSSDDYVNNLLKERNIDDIPNFLNPNLDLIQSPFDLDNIKEVIDLIKTKANCKAITIVDSDCDGYCASAILIKYLKHLYPNWTIDFYIHEKKSHGLEDVVIDNFIDLNNYDLVFIPDAGSNDDSYIEQYPNIDFIILDHHLRTISTNLPNNAILVNNQLSNKYNNKSLSGAGVTWQLCHAFDILNNDNYANNLLDLASVAIIGDVMNITTLENRAIINYGLNHINDTFLQLLIDNASFSIGKDLTPTAIAFYIVPAINSMTRMGTLAEKNRMFMSFITPYILVESHKRGVEKGTQVEVSIESVRECTNTKSKQKRIQEKMAELCSQKILENDMLNNKILIIELGEEFDDIPTEMNGLAATKISNDYNHPTLIGRINSQGVLQGSIRGLSTIDMPPLKTFLESSGYFEMLAGHDLAAGFAISKNKIEPFLQWANNQLKNVDMNSNTWYVDYSLNANDTNRIKKIINDMDTLKHCWGQGMPEALIHINNLNVNRTDITVMGKNTDTVKVYKDGIAYMFFKKTIDEIKQITQYNNAIFEIVGTANMNEWNGRYTPQIFVNDYIVKDNTYGF